MRRTGKSIATRWRTTACAALAVLLVGAGCTSGIDLLGDGDYDRTRTADADGDADADRNADVDVAVEADDEAEAEIDIAADAFVDDGDAVADEGDAGAVTCVGGWYDPSSGLCWQDPPDEEIRTWDDAVAYCDAVSMGGHDDWHLPTISELRSLVRGCVSTGTGGPCGVTDGCLHRGCSVGGCRGCEFFHGPGSGGAYWPDELFGVDPVSWYWSSASLADDGSHAWVIAFQDATVSDGPKNHLYYARCVRPGP